MSVIDEATLRSDLPLPARFYWQMAVIRELEDTLLRLFQENQLFGTTHTSIGQEANAVALMNAIDRERDTVWSNHRCHGHFIAYCGQVVPLLAEILGRTGGVCGGRGGSQHLCYARFHSSGIQGGLVPLGVGTALADRDAGAISVVMLGDGTMGEGVVYEGLNLASLWSLPVLFVVEDNGIAQTTPKALGVSGSIRARAEPFGIRTFGAAETDVFCLHELANEAVDYVRNEQKPAWLHLESIRLGPHSKGDDTRSESELSALRARDPLTVVADQVGDSEGLLGEARGFVAEALSKAQGMSIACA
ncbi:MAG: thiamine pyrophosphate-dependent dehydrogenase E1 component subunit alpha [Alphaproteobacteria bacterium]|nr:thiamine pyrophosphate-dependent dehydrogenase E1 component subunit alpha [Alphaproteobacteria bacterium]